MCNIARFQKKPSYVGQVTEHRAEEPRCSVEPRTTSVLPRWRRQLRSRLACGSSPLDRDFAKDWRSSLAAFLTRFTHIRMPVLILSVCVAEPPFASRAVHCCRITTRLIVGRHALAQALDVGTFLFVETVIAVLQKTGGHVRPKLRPLSSINRTKRAHSIFFQQWTDSWKSDDNVGSQRLMSCRC
jgi:hypothetical protein